MKSVSSALVLVMAGAALVALAGCKKPQGAQTSTAGPAGAAVTQMANAAPAANSGSGGGSPAAGSGMPAVGACSSTTVSQVGSRLEDSPGSGSAISYSNGGGQVSYDTVPGIVNSHVGDPVQLCVAELPQNCPPGDNRGIVYAATNQRTGETWKQPDSGTLLRRGLTH